MKMEQSVPKRWHLKFRRREITQKKTYNIKTRRKYEIKNKVKMRYKHEECVESHKFTKILQCKIV